MMGVSEVQWTTREGDPGPERLPEWKVIWAETWRISQVKGLWEERP
jgi:hypothetical protein